MVKNKTTKIIQVPIEDELLRRIALDRLYMEGHQRHPENLDWAKSAAKLLSKRLPKEKW